MPRNNVHIHYSRAEREQALSEAGGGRRNRDGASSSSVGGSRGHGLQQRGASVKAARSSATAANNNHHNQNQHVDQQVNNILSDAGNLLKMVEGFLPSSPFAALARRSSNDAPTSTNSKWPPPITPPTPSTARRRRRGTLEEVGSIDCKDEDGNDATEGTGGGGDATWRRSRSVPATPRHKRAQKKQQLLQQQHHQNNQSEQQRSRTPSGNENNLAAPPKSPRSSFRMKSGTLDRTMSALVRRTSSKKRAKSPRRAATKDSGECSTATGEVSTQTPNSAPPATTTSDAATSPSTAKSSVMQQAESITEDVLHWCEASLPRLRSPTSPSNGGSGRSALSGIVRGPFVRAPTADIASLKSNNSESNFQAAAEGSEGSGGPDLQGLELSQDRRQDTRDQAQQKQQQQRHNSDSSTSSLEVNHIMGHLSPYPSPCTSPKGTTTSAGRKSPGLQQQQHVDVDPASANKPVSPCTSPYLRRKRGEHRASSTGSTGNVAPTPNLGSYNSRGSPFSSSHHHLHQQSAPAPPSSSAGAPLSPSNLLSPYSVSPSPSHPASPTTPSPHHSLLARRLSSCRPSLSSCSSSLFSFPSSTRECHSPDPPTAAVSSAGHSSHTPSQHHPLVGASSSNPGPPPASPMRSPNKVTKTASLGSSSVFVYPNSPGGGSSSIMRMRSREDLGALNPDLYRLESLETQANDDQAEVAVRFRLDYNEAKEWLEVVVVKIKALPRDTKEVTIRVALLPDEKRVITESMQFPGDKRDVEIGKTFIIPVQKPDLTNRSLKICLSSHSSGGGGKAWGSSGQRKPSVTHLGEVTKPFKIINFESSEIQLFTETLRNSQQQQQHHHHPQHFHHYQSADSGCGPDDPSGGSSDFDHESRPPRARIALCYNCTHERLTVTIYECENAENLETSAGKCYVKLSFQHGLKNCRSKKTDSVRFNDKLSFDQSFNFKVEQDSLADVGVTIQLMGCTNILDKDRVLGQIVVGSAMFSKGSGLDHWRLATGRKAKETVLMWHNLLNVE